MKIKNRKIKKNEIKGIILAILAAIISGISIPANKIFVISSDPLIFTALRSILIGLFFFIIISFKTNFRFKEFKKFSWKYLIAIATIGGSLAFFLFFLGLKLTTSARAVFIYKEIILFDNFFFKRRLTRTKGFAGMLISIGLPFILADEISPGELWKNPELGDFLVIVAVLLWGLEKYISNKEMIKEEHNFFISFSKMFFGGAILLSSFILLGKVDIIFNITISQILNIFISTLIFSLFILFWYWSIRYISISKAASILLLSPIVTFIIGILFFNEPLTLMQNIGYLLILVGAYYLAKTRSEFV